MILETLFRIHGEDGYTYLEIGYEGDCVDSKGPLVELRSYCYNQGTKNFDITDRIAVDVKSIPAIIEALSHFKKD